MKKSKLLFSYKTIYMVLDILAEFAIYVLAFLAFYGFDGFKENLVPIMIFASSMGVVTFLTFLIARLYKVVTTQVGIYDSLRIMTSTLLVQLLGLVVISFVPYLPSFQSFFLLWMFSAMSLVFIHAVIRIAVRIFVIASSVHHKKEKVKTIIIGAGTMGKVVSE